MSCGKSRGLKIGRTDNITSFNEIIAETALACAVLTCGSDSDEPPPTTKTIDEIEAQFITPRHAPYIDEHTAKLERKINDKDEIISELESEIDRLEKEAEAHVRSDKRHDSISDDSDDNSDNISNVSKGLGEFSASFYTARCEGCSGITATGIDVSQTIYSEGRRVIAVDPSVIKLGSIVRVTLENGESFEAVAGDTGGAIKGARIDVLVESKEEANRLGRQSAKVEVLK